MYDVFSTVLGIGGRMLWCMKMVEVVVKGREIEKEAGTIWPGAGHERFSQPPSEKEAGGGSGSQPPSLKKGPV